MKQKITIRDIARHCNVSIATVSRALNGSPHVGEEIRRKILGYVDDIGWQSQGIRHKLKPAEVKNVVIAAAHDVPQNRRFIQELCRKLQELNYLPLVVYGQRSVTLRQSLHYAPEALIVIGMSDRLEEALADLAANGVKVIGVGDSFRHPCATVVMDHAGAARAAAAAFRAAGHREIAFFSGFGGLAHVRKLEEVKVHRVFEVAQVLCEEFPEFDPARDMVSDCFEDLTAFRAMLRSEDRPAWLVLDTIRYSEAARCLMEFDLVEKRQVIALLDDNRTPVVPLRSAFYCCNESKMLDRVIELVGTPAESLPREPVKIAYDLP